MNPKPTHTSRERGQSLVEFALYLIIVFIPLLAGIIEVSQYVVTQNRVSTASRAAARFGANGGEDEGMLTVIQNNVRDTMRIDLSPDRWDIWAIRGTVNNEGTSFNSFEFNRIYGNGQTERFSTIVTDTVRSEILEDLQKQNRGAGKEQIVGTLILYDTDSLLGINNLWAGPFSLRGLNVLRYKGLDVAQTNGCAVFPIAIDATILSSPLPTGGYIYPTGTIPNNGNFPFHENGKLIADSREGTIFVLNIGQFNWLAWNQSRTDAAALIGSMKWPGNSLDQSQPFPNQAGYVDPDDTTDTTIHVGDRLTRSNVADLNTVLSDDLALKQHVERGRTLRLIVWDETKTKVGGFAVFRFHGYGPIGSPSWITAEFIQNDTSCGQVAPEANS